MTTPVTNVDPRYLVPFHPKSTPHYFTDVLIIGGGIAGIRAALSLGRNLRALVITKDELQLSNSQFAQGGIASVWDPEDRFENHVSDTLRAGGDLCDPKIVDMIVREAPARVRELIQWGVRFDEDAEGLQLGREGGHSHFRIIHALGDATGKEIMRALIDQARRHDQLDLWPNTFTLDLLTADGECVGAHVWNSQHGRTLVWAKQTILCTGGAGQLYRETTNPSVATGDGHALAYRAGAELRDMEFMQFHPTVLYIAGGSRSLITEAMRGEGAHLVDKTGYRFMFDYDERGELAPRDVVSRAIVAQMEKTRYSSVFLYLGHLNPDHVRQRFPGMAALCQEFGLEITRDKIPVRPGSHYMIGGVTVNDKGQTTVPRLWAAGEVTSSGLHGANRLASNSLLEGLVMGAHSGEGAAEAAANMPDRYQALPIDEPRNDESSEPLDLVDIRNSLKSSMWRHVGVRRESTGLIEARDQIASWCSYVLRRQFSSPQGWELQNLLTVARMTVEASLRREESRGVHWRIDFPKTDNEQWRGHLTFQRSDRPLVARFIPADAAKSPV